MKTIKLTAEQARDLYEKHPEMRDTILNAFTDEELGIKPKPFTWYDLGEIEGVWVDIDSKIRRASQSNTIDRNRNILPHKSDAEKALATAQLLQLALHYNNGVHQKDIKFPYYCACYWDSTKIRPNVNPYTSLYNGGIKFLREEDLQKCIDDNPELWNKYFYL